MCRYKVDAPRNFKEPPEDLQIIPGKLKIIRVDASDKKIDLERELDITYEWCRDRRQFILYTDEALNLGRHLEIIYDNKDQCFKIKYYRKLRRDAEKRRKELLKERLEE